MFYQFHNDDFDVTQPVAAVDLAEAQERVREWIGQFDFDLRHGTVWSDVDILDARGVPVETVVVRIDPPPPPCPRRACHNWQRPYEFVGHDRAHPGVVGHGEGFIIYECCTHCGARRVTDTWAERPDTGEHGYTSVWYDGPGYYEVASAA